MNYEVFIWKESPYFREKITFCYYFYKKIYIWSIFRTKDYISAIRFQANKIYAQKCMKTLLKWIVITLEVIVRNCTRWSKAKKFKIVCWFREKWTKPRTLIYKQFRQWTLPTHCATFVCMFNGPTVSLSKIKLNWVKHFNVPILILTGLR